MNDEITVARAAEALGTDTEFIDVTICPDEHIERYGVWNAETCIALTIALMIDDDARVASVC